MNSLRKSFDILDKVFRGDGYINIIMNGMGSGDPDKAAVTKIVYGTTEKWFELAYIVDSFVKETPKPVIRLLLMQAIYCLRYLSMPEYAVVNESVKLAEELGKTELKGFVNAVLKNVAAGKYKLPAEGEPRYKEVRYNLPEWLVDKIAAEYPSEYDAFLTAKPREEEHIRLNAKLTGKEASFEKLLPPFEKTYCGYYVRYVDKVKQLFREGVITVQGLTSAYAVKAFGEIKGKSFLDLCAAPGGKSVFAAELGADVTACDLRGSRVDLIRSYAERMKVRLKTVVSDATALREEWSEKYDCVLIDAPCSGLGAIAKRKDIGIKATPEAIKNVTGVQKRILEVGSKYVKKGGILVYSTCTVMKDENINAVNEFLKKHHEFVKEPMPLPRENDGTIQFLPDSAGTEGFFIARLKKIC